MSEQTLDLNLTVAEVNLVLEALGAQPFARVAGLIQNLQKQAQAQLTSGSEAPSND